MTGNYMQVITPVLIKDKKVLLRYDMDVALKSVSRVKGQGSWEVAEDFKLRAGIQTLKLCLANASKVIIVGHLGRPARIAMQSVAGGPNKYKI